MKSVYFKSNPLMLFWVGVLTGALLVGLVFLYKIYTPEMGANLFRWTVPKYLQSESVQSQSYGVPTPTLQGYGVPTPTTQGYGVPTPTNGR